MIVRKSEERFVPIEVVLETQDELARFIAILRPLQATSLLASAILQQFDRIPR